MEMEHMDFRASPQKQEGCGNMLAQNSFYSSKEDIMAKEFQPEDDYQSYLQENYVSMSTI